MDKLKNMKETLSSCVQMQLADIKNADTHELGEAVDMIKDLEEAMYYCAMTKAIEEDMKEKEEKPSEFHHYYTEKIREPYYDRDIDRDMGRMYYSERQPRNAQGEFTDGRSRPRGFHEREVPMELRDTREGRSPISRRMYMESKEMHHDKDKKIKELEKYMQELTEDVVEMIEGASPEERQTLEKKMV